MATQWCRAWGGNRFWGQAWKLRGPCACVLVLLCRISRLLTMCFRNPMLLLTVCNQIFKLILSKRKSEEIVESVCKAARAFSEVLFLNQISLPKRLLSSYSWWHLTSEMTGQLYCESFNQFHDQAHWSAEFIVLLRVTFRFTFISGGLMTYSGSEKQDQLRTSMEDVALFSDIGLVAFSILVPIHKLLITQFRKRSEDVAWVCTASYIALSCVFALFEIFHQELLHCCTWRI